MIPAALNFSSLYCAATFGRGSPLFASRAKTDRIDLLCCKERLQAWHPGRRNEPNDLSGTPAQYCPE